MTDGEPVNAAVTNRLPATNATNAAYLHSVLKQGYDNSGEFLRGMPVADDVAIGDFVYYDAATRRFEKALARFTADRGFLEELESSVVWGVVTAIRDNRADLCTSGLCRFTPATDAYTRSPSPGHRYLSDTLPGRPSTDVKNPFKCLGFLVGVKQTGEVQFFVRPYLVIVIVIANICGGGGTALLMAGPFGLLLGAVLGVAVALLAVTMGKEKAMQMAKSFAIPSNVSPFPGMKVNPLHAILTDKKIDKCRTDMSNDLSKKLDDASAEILKEVESKVERLIRDEISRLSIVNIR